MLVRWFGRLRLGTRLTLAVVALLVPLELLVFFTGRHSLDERRAAELENAVLVGQALAAVVDGFASDLQSSILPLAFALGSQTWPLEQSAAAQELNAVLQQHPALRTIFATDPQGRVIASPAGGIGFDVSDRPYIRSLQAGAETTWADNLIGVQTGESTAVFARVVRGADGAVRGYLVAAFYPQQLIDTLPFDLPTDARVLIINDGGVVIYRSDREDEHVDVSNSPIVWAVLGGTPVRVVGQSVPFPGEPRFGVFAPVARLGWAVGFTRPYGAVEEALVGRTLVETSGIALILLLSAGAMILSARRITRPLTMLAATANAIARDERPTIPDIAADAELQELASAMRVMGSAVAEREAALLEQRESFRVTLASIGDAVVATDAEGRVTFMNPTAEALTGWRQEEARGRGVRSMFSLLNADTRARVDDPIVRVLRHGMVVGLGNHTVLVTRDGDERTIDDSAAPIRNAQGELVGVVMVFRDVSERREMEASLRQSEARLAGIIGSAMDAVISIDETQRIVTFNPAAESMFGCSAQDALGQPLDRFIPERFRHSHAEHIRAFGRTGLTGRIMGALQPLTALRLDGREFPIEATISRVDLGEQKLFTVIIRDITERRRLEVLQQEFIATTTHELRTPLTSMKGFVQLLQRGRVSTDRVVDVLASQVTRLDQLVGQLLDVTRLEAGRLTLTRSEIDLCALALSAVEQTQGLSDHHHIRLLAPEQPVVGDWEGDRLRDIFENLLSNAIKYSPEGGEIAVRIQAHSTYAEVSVRDQGVGIDPQDLDHLFERFYRVEATAGDAHGLGLGLHISQSLVEAHGGRIWAVSDGPGQGSTFMFVLPYQPPGKSS